jgi:tetratricopeptide (TPR) repeat protein
MNDINSFCLTFLATGSGLFGLILFFRLAGRLYEKAEMQLKERQWSLPARLSTVFDSGVVAREGWRLFKDGLDENAEGTKMLSAEIAGIRISSRPGASLQDKAMAYNLLAAVAAQRNDLTSAEDYGTKSLSCYKQPSPMDLVFGNYERIAVQISTHLLLSQVYFLQNKRNRLLGSLEAARALSLTKGLRLPQTFKVNVLAPLYRNLGTFYQEDDRLRESFECFDIALKILQQAHDESSEAFQETEKTLLQIQRQLLAKQQL